MRFKTLSEWLAYQETLHPKAMAPGLERVRTVHERLGGHRPAPVVITVAGTNGKGSCIALLDAMLRAGGYRVASYTSPHIERYNERITFDGECVSDRALVESFGRVDSARGDVSLTYFEFGTLAAFDLMARARPDVALLEVGLGGRLDAVNIIDPDCALITAIGLDHTEWLGDSLEAIAREKAGIMRAGKPVIVGQRHAPRTLAEHARSLGAVMTQPGAGYDYRVSERRWEWWRGGERPKTLPRPALEGPHQLENAAACLAVLASLADSLPLSEAAVARGLEQARAAGRMQHRTVGGVEVLLDVAHNAEAAGSLAATLRQMPSRSPTVAVFAQLRDKPTAAIVAALKPCFDGWHLAGLEGSRGLDAATLAERVAPVAGANAAIESHTVADALNRALAAAWPHGRVVVFGSFRTIGEAVRTLSSVPASHTD